MKAILYAAAAFFLLCLAGLVSAFPRNDSLYNMPDTSWKLITNLWPNPPELFTLVDYSGMVYNPHRHTIMLHGGGHAATGHTNVIEFSFASMRWDSLTPSVECFRYDSAYCVFYNGFQTGGVYNAAGEPVAVSRHSYDGVSIPHDTDLMIVAVQPWSQGSGGNACTGYSSTYGKSGLWDGNSMWIFNRATLKWSYTWAADDAGYYAPITHRMSCLPGGSTAWHPDRGRLYGVSGGYLVEWDYRQETERILATMGWGAELDRALNYYPAWRSLLYFEKDDIYQWSFADSHWTAKNVSGNYPAADYISQICHDTLNDVFFTFWDTAFQYYSPRTNAWTKVPYPASFPPRAASKNIVYDPVNNVAIVVTAALPPESPWTRRLTWAYKFSNTPGRFPGTLDRGSRTEASGRDAPRVSLATTPDPFSPEGRIQVALPLYGNLTLDVVDIGGRPIQRITSGPRAPGVHAFRWDGGRVPAGLYFLRLESDAGNLTKRIVVLK